MLAAGVLGLAWSAGAQPAVPAELSALAQPRLAGSAHYTYWGFDVYDAALWVEPGFRADEPERGRFALELKYLRSFKGGDIARRSITEMKRVGDFTEAQEQAWLLAMQAAFPDVAVGDRLTGIHLPGQGARFLANGRPSGDVSDPEFARLFFGIWLSDKSSEPQKRAVLLGRSGAGSKP